LWISAFFSVSEIEPYLVPRTRSDTMLVRFIKNYTRGQILVQTQCYKRLSSMSI